MAINRVAALKLCLNMRASNGKLRFENIKRCLTICENSFNKLLEFINISCFFSFVSLAKIPVRLNVGIMLFMASFTSYMLRVNFSIIIIAMTKLSPPVSSGNGTESLIVDPFHGLIDDSFNWSKKDQGLLLSAYFYGYIFPNLLGGFLSEKFGGRRVIFIGMFISAIVTGLSPLTASDNFMFMFGARLVLGVLGVRTERTFIRCSVNELFPGLFVSSLPQHYLKVVAV